MKITGLQVFDCQLNHRGGWNPIIVRVDTDAGISGWGEAAAAYSIGAKAIATMIESLAGRRGLLLGEDPRSNHVIYGRLRGVMAGPYGGGGVAFGALSAIDIALWDIKGQALGEPVHRLLGGPFTTHLRTYANGWCYNMETPEQYAECAKRCLADSFTAVKFDPFRHDPGEFRNVPRRGKSTQPKWLQIAVDRVNAVREAVGPQVDIILECHAKFNLVTAGNILDAMEPFNLLYVEEPCQPNPENYRSLQAGTTIPLACGERLNTPHDFLPYFRDQSIAVAQPDVGACGGITGVLHIAQLADVYGIEMQPHNANSPLLTHATAQATAAMPNAFIQECFPYRPSEFMQLVHHPLEYFLKDSYLPVSNEPGIDAQPNIELLQRFARPVVTH